MNIHVPVRHRLLIRSQKRKTSHLARLSPCRLASILREQFLLLQAAYPELAAMWDHILGSEVSGDWTIVGPDRAVIQFKALAKRAARLMHDVGEGDELGAWLEGVRREGSNFIYGLGAGERDVDGTDRDQHIHGTIVRLGEASAIYCRVLERRARAAESEVRRAADARNEVPPQVGVVEFVRQKGVEPSGHARIAGTVAANEPESAGATTVARIRRGGPRRDLDTAIKVDEVVASLTSHGNWHDHMEEICEALDQMRIRCPKTWKARGHATWYDCMVMERRLVNKAIGHHLSRAREYKMTFS